MEPGDLPPGLAYQDAAVPPFEDMLPIYGPPLLYRWLAYFGGNPVGEETITVSTTVKTLTRPQMAVSAVATVEVASIRLTLAGTAAASGTGLLFVAGTVINLTGMVSLQNAQLIRAGGSDATVSVAYFD